MSDSVERILADWREVRPDLDPGPLDVVGRVIVLAERLRASVEEDLAKHELSLGQFDILATLRRHGGRMSPGALLKTVALSSGGMTNRLDRLEAAGWIQREDDPDDRRGVMVRLTPKGKKLIDIATETRFENARKEAPPLTAAETKKLAELLKRWMSS